MRSERFLLTRKGFSLIELLIALVIIGVILGIIITLIQSSRNKAHDTRIKSDIKQLRSLTEVYYENNNLSYLGFDACIENPSSSTCIDETTTQAVTSYKQDIEQESGQLNSLKSVVAEKTFCISAPLKSDPSIYVCAESSGSVNVQGSQNHPCSATQTGPRCVFTEGTPQEPTEYPTLIAHSPQGGNIPLAEDLILDFSERVSAFQGNIYITKQGETTAEETIDVATAPITSNQEGDTLTVDRTDDLTPATSYFVTIDEGAFIDIDNLPFAGLTDPNEWTFTTQAPPQLISTAPQGPNIPITSELSMTFENPVTRIANKYVRLNRVSPPPTEQYLINIMSGTNAGNVVTVDPDLSYSTQYYITIDQGALQDEQNNLPYAGLSDTNAWRFTTVAAPTPPPVANGEPADFVLGQGNFSSSVSATTQSGMKRPVGIEYSSATNKLFVADFENYRILNFDTVSITNGEPAVNVLGQTDFTSAWTALNASRMEMPIALSFQTAINRLFVADHMHNRVLVFDTSTITNGEPAINVLGQMNFTSALSAITQSGMRIPLGVSLDKIKNLLFVSDGGNNRVLVFDMSTITNGEAAVNVLGQTSFTSATAAISQTGMRQPGPLTFDQEHNRLFVSDTLNSRVLVFDTSTITNGEPAANVLGQTNFTSSTIGTTEVKMSYPTGLAFDSQYNRLFAVDSSNHRVLVFDTSTITNGEAAVNVLGQTSFTSSTSGTTQAKLKLFSLMSGIAYDSNDGRLFVSDEGNNRVLVWDW